MRHSPRIELTHEGLPIWLGNHYTTWGAPCSNGNENVRRIPPNSNTGALPSDGVYRHIQDTRWGVESYPYAELQSVYFTTSNDREQIVSIVLYHPRISPARLFT